MPSSLPSDEADASTIEYEVLYYKRKNKVHKSKGVTKTDGRLKVCAKKHQIVLLEQRGGGKHENGNNSSSSNSVVHSCINKELATKCRALNNEDTMVLGGYEVEILSRIQKLNSSGNVSTGSSLRSTQPFGSRIVKAASTNAFKKVISSNPTNPVLRAKPASTPLRKICPVKRKFVAPTKTDPNAAVRNSKSTDDGSDDESAGSPDEAGEGDDADDDDDDDGDKIQASLRPIHGITQRPVKSMILPQRRLLAPIKSTVPGTAAPKGLGTGHEILSVPSLHPHQRFSGEHAAEASGATTHSSRRNEVLPHIPLPASLVQVLRPHQVTGVDFLWKALQPSSSSNQVNSSNSNNCGGAILADEMGLGKTLMTVAIVAARHRQERSKQFLVVCPSSLVKNWANEFDKWLGRAGQPKRVVMEKGGEKGRAQILAYCSSMKQNLTNHLGQVLICSYDLFRMNVELFSGISSRFQLLVVDEGHRLKNSAGSLTLSALQSIACDARLLLTATPIQNNLTEFYTLASFCRPGIFGELSDFRRSYERPISAMNQKNASRQDRSIGLTQSRSLEQLTQTFMLRRLQKDVLKTMLPRRIEALLFCQPSPEQCALYNQLSQNSQGSSMSDALTTLTALRKICSHPSLLDEEDLEVASEMEPSIGLSGKLIVLDALLQSIREHAPHDKIVIVSNFTSALTMIETRVLKPRKLSYSRLDGSINLANRQSLVDRFNRAQADSQFCFLLSSKAGGCGLNLVGANRLVMFDPDWNPASDVQAMGRVYRQGQAKETFIYRFFTAGTLEEVIYQRQSQKGNLAVLTVDGNTAGDGGRPASAATSARFTKEEIKDCFTLKEGCLCDTQRKIGTSWSYEGPTSLDCNEDAPLLHVAETMPKTLGYVHIVNDRDAEGLATEPSNPTEEDADETSLYDSDQEAEFEF